MAEPVKLALIGCGGIALSHVNGYHNLVKGGYDRFVITAVCDVNEENARNMAGEIENRFGNSPQVFATVEELVEGAEVDGADICLPHAFHHTGAIPLLERGIAVMVEKPIGITVRATRRMMEAAERSGATIATAEQIRRCTGARAIEWAINDQQMMGAPRFFSMEVFGDTAFDWTQYKMAWRGVRLLGGGGQIFDGGVHFSDMMLHVFGPVDEVVCDLRNYEGPEIDAPILGKARVDVEDYWTATLRFESGLVGHWSWSRVGLGHDVATGVYYGDKGSFKDKQKWMHAFQFGADLLLEDGTEVPYEEIERQYLDQLDDETKERLFPCGLGDGISNECWDFVEAIAEGREPEIDAVGGLKAKSLSLALYESATCGEPVKVADVEEGRIEEYQRPINEYWNI
ncbi:MAG: Gfo/Idh/MocA family oxidoreductase [Armatimonadetes bacterium]|nr:Gfo/Idh/MocA family oxidoreductase [Armatimonadota bacterium]